MSKKILVICSSYRKGGNSETLADSFIQGARSAGNAVEKVRLADGQIAFCRGCLCCQGEGVTSCVIDDYANVVSAKMHDADVIVFATPVYYYGMSGNLKTMLDRANPLYGGDYKFTDIYLLATAADDGEGAVRGTLTGIECWAECFERCSVKGYVFAGGVEKKGDIGGRRELQDAFTLGKAIS